MFKRQGTHVRQVSLPDERKALVERYMIDADEAAARAQQAGEKHTLAHREAGAQAHREAEAQAHREAEAQAHREAEAREAEAQAHRETETQAHREARQAEAQLAGTERLAIHAEAHAVIEPSIDEQDAPPPGDTRDDASESLEDLPVYVWLQNVVPTSPDAADWPRELVKAKEARSDIARETSAPS
jgi:hypothetical protein